MDDLDRLFALVDLVSDPKAAKKNTEDMKAVRAEKVENSKLVKEAKAISFENAKEKDRLAAYKTYLDKMRDEIKEYDEDTTRSRRDLESARLGAIAVDNKRKDQMKEAERTHAKKVSELKAKLALVETSVADAQNRKKLAEDAMDNLRQKVGA